MSARRRLGTEAERDSRLFHFWPGHVGGRVPSAQPIRRRGGTRRGPAQGMAGYDTELNGTATVVGVGTVTAVGYTPPVLGDPDANKIWTVAGGGTFGPVHNVIVVLGESAVNPKLYLTNTSTSAQVTSTKSGSYSSGATLTWAFGSALGSQEFHTLSVQNFITADWVVLSSVSWN